MFNIVDKAFKTLVLTDFGRHRVLEHITGKAHPEITRRVGIHNIEGYNLTHVVFGDYHYTDGYGTDVTEVGHPTATVELKESNISMVNNTFVISAELESRSDIREIGVYETINGKRYLFAYIACIMIKRPPTNLLFKIILNISLEMSFIDFDYQDYDVVLKEGSDGQGYAVKESLEDMYDSLTRVQFDLERCIQKNARLIGFNKANVYYNTELKIAECFSTVLLVTRFNKVLTRFIDESMTDYYIFPSRTSYNYKLKNFVDETAYMEVVGDIFDSNKDHIDFTRPTTISYTGTITSMDKCGTIFAKAKSSPDSDEGYLEFVISADDVTDPSSERYLKFTAHSYDMSLEQQLTMENAPEFEPQLVGEYSIVYYITKDTDIYKNVHDRECTFTFTFNGDKDNPKFEFYLNDIHITSDEKIDAGLVQVDNFNYSAPPIMGDFVDDIYGDIDESQLDYKELRRIRILREAAERHYNLRRKYYESFRDDCTLKNYSTFMKSEPLNTSDDDDRFYVTPQYYTLNTIIPSSIVTFSKELPYEDIVFLANVSRS